MRKNLAILLTILPVASAETGNFSYFCLFESEPEISGYWFDGSVLGGPYRANGPVCIWSTSESSGKDPWFYSLALASPFYYCSDGVPENPASTPICGNLTIQPIDSMLQGPPWFVLGAEPIPFGPDSVDWQSTRTAAIFEGLYFPPGDLSDGSRLILRGDSLLVKETYSSAAQGYWLGGLEEPVIWIENGPAERIYIRDDSDTWPGLSMPLTIGSNGSVFLAGPLVCLDGDALLGLVSVHGSMIIALDPQSVGGTDWPYPWDIRTDQPFQLDCSMLALEGHLQAENFDHPPGPVDLPLHGGVQMVGMGYTCTPCSGYRILFEYDERLLAESPPHYPAYDTGTGIGGGDSVVEPAVLGASPNPFTSSTTVTAFGAPDGSRFCVYDVSGRLVSTLETAGGTMTLDGSSLPAGLLFVHPADPGAGAAVRLVHTGR